MAHFSIDLKLIQELRVERGISIEEMSKRLGYDNYDYYYKKERGIRKLSVEDIARIASVLNVPIESLFFEEIVTELETVHK